MRPHLQAPSACRGQGYPGEGGGAWTRSIGKAATFLRSHRREAAELEFEWGGIEGRALIAAAAAEKAAIQHWLRPIRTKDAFKPRVRAASTCQPPSSPPLTAVPVAPPRGQSARCCGRPDAVLTASTPVPAPRRPDGTGAHPVRSDVLPWQVTSSSHALPTHRSRKMVYPRLPKMPASEEKPPLSYSLSPQ